MAELQRVKIGVPTLHRYDLLLRFCCAFAAESDPRVVPEITILDNGGGFIASREGQELSRKSNLPPISVVAPPYNFGVAKSFNWFAENLGQCIVAGDDTVISTRTIKAFVNAAFDHPEAIIIGHDHPSQSLAVMMLARPKEWLEMGGFDECFYPAYFEDNDARRRLELAGKPIATIKAPDWHHDNSSSLHGGSVMYQRNHWGSFYRNQLYYQLKWGGPPDAELFMEPFNKKECCQ